MKLKEFKTEQTLDLEGFNFEETLKKTVSEVQGSYFDGPEIFVEKFIQNSPKLQELGDKNKWESSEDVYTQVDKKIRSEKQIVVSQKELAILVIKVLSEEFVKPKEKEVKVPTKKEVKKKDLTFKIVQSLVGREIEYNKELIPVEEFEEKINEDHPEKHTFEYSEKEVTVKFESIKEQQVNEDDELEEEGEDDED